MALLEIAGLPASVRGSVLKEHVLFDNRVAQALIAASGLSMGRAQLALGHGAAAMAALSTVHRADLSARADRSIEQLFKDALGSHATGQAEVLRRAVHDYPSTITPQPNTTRFFEDPASLLKGNMIVLKSPGPNERGVVCLYYSFVNPLFLRLFDAPAVVRDYFVVLQPSWSGYCDPNILAFTKLDAPVFVGATEPRDAAFIDGLGTNLVTAPFSSNCWVDPRLFHPIAGVEKDIDIIVIAAWSDYKRHWAVFRALQRLAQRGLRPRVALVGYAIGLSQDDIRAQARHFGVEEQLDFHERLSPAEVNHLLNRSKVNLLWSRREGVNRAIIEGMFADVPCVVRSGFNYGYEYPYINSQTGRYATEEGLPDVLADMLKNTESFSPYAWVSNNMSPQTTTRALQGSIKRVALGVGEAWTRDLAVKVNVLDGLAYYDPSEHERFKADYERLRSLVRVRRNGQA